MRLHRDYDLQALNTLRLPARARYYVRADSLPLVVVASDWARSQGLPLLVLGGGSNLVLGADFPGLVLHVALMGLRSERRGASQRLTVAAGEDWPTLVERCLAEGWYGLENLSLIPGSVGAAPVQNIGAYGVELADCLRAVHGWHRDSRQFQTLVAAQCGFGYRDSIFKGLLRDRFIITGIELELSREFQPCLDYPALRRALPDPENTAPNARQVADAVIAIRRSRLPDPAELANAGSFFKNPVISETRYRDLCRRCSHGQSGSNGQFDSNGQPPVDIPRFPAPDGVKIPAAWLLDWAGWKGVRRGPVGMHSRQALVLVNYGGATAKDVMALAEEINADMRRRFGLTLEVEPRIYV